MRRSHLLHHGLQTLLWSLLAVVVAHTLAGLGWRLDLTADGRHRLAPVSLETARSLGAPVVARVYASSGLAAPYHDHRARVLDLLGALAEASEGELVVVDLDPTGHPERAASARASGVRPVPYSAPTADGREARTVFLGVVLEQGERRVVVDFLPSVARMEYELTRGLRGVTTDDDERPTLGWVVGHGEPDPRALPEGSPLRGLLAELSARATVRPVALDRRPEVDVLLLVGPQAPLGAEAQVWLDQYVMGGGALLAFVSSVRPDFDGDGLVAVPHGLEALVAGWGVVLGHEVLIDRASHDVLAVPVADASGVRRVVQLRHPLAPVSRNLDRTARPVRDLDHLVLPFASPLSAVPGRVDPAVQRVWVQTGKSAVAVSTVPSLDPTGLSVPLDGEREGPHDVLRTLEGRLPSGWAGRPLPGGLDLSVPPLSAPTRVAIAGTADVVPNHPELVSNLVDWALDDPALLAIRSRGGVASPLRWPSSTARNGVKLGVVLVPLGLLSLLVGWLSRRPR